MPKPLINLFRDLFFHLCRTLCIIRRRHHDVREIGAFHKIGGGYRPVPLRQCSRCREILISEQDAARLGGKRELKLKARG